MTEAALEVLLGYNIKTMTSDYSMCSNLNNNKFLLKKQKKQNKIKHGDIAGEYEG